MSPLYNAGFLIWTQLWDGSILQALNVAIKVPSSGGKSTIGLCEWRCEGGRFCWTSRGLEASTYIQWGNQGNIITWNPFGAGDVDGINTTHRVIADHVRTLSLSNGGISNNVGRRYVLHHILHRHCWYVRKKLDASIGSFFSSLLHVVVEQMVRRHFPYHFTCTNLVRLIGWHFSWTQTET